MYYTGERGNLIKWLHQLNNTCCWDNDMLNKYSTSVWMYWREIPAMPSFVRGQQWTVGWFWSRLLKILQLIRRKWLVNILGHVRQQIVFFHTLMQLKCSAPTCTSEGFNWNSHLESIILSHIHQSVIPLQAAHITKPKQHVIMNCVFVMFHFFFTLFTWNTQGFIFILGLILTDGTIVSYSNTALNNCPAIFLYRSFSFNFVFLRFVVERLLSC